MPARNEPNPDEGQVEMHSGNYLYWKRNAAGGREFTSDEIPTGVLVWDTCLVDFGTLCEAISMELSLLGVERRAAERRAFEQQRAANPDAPERTPEDAIVDQVDQVDEAFSMLAVGAATEDFENDLLNGILIRTLRRAMRQLQRYSADDPVAAEIKANLTPEGIRAALSAAMAKVPK